MVPHLIKFNNDLYEIVIDDIVSGDELSNNECYFKIGVASLDDSTY